jgi:eukaryotic-like serine/threonine-protein kinase
MPPMTGRVIAGRYNLQHPIGRGAMGVVWRARDQLLDREVAIKEVVISALIGAEERRNAYQRTLREARTAARLSHRGVVTIYDVVEEDARPWIVMELVPSQSLDQVLAVDGRLPTARAGRIGQQLLSALASAHAAGVLHRDVKPSNVLIAASRSGDGWEERAVLTDFGIAQFEGDPRLTQTGMVMGSPGFTAPERIRGGDATPGSDLWSLGATIYAAVEGRGPYEQRGGAITTMSAIINEDAPVAPHAGKLAPLIAALLRRDPSARPSASAAARMFADVLPQLGETADEPPAMAHPATARSAYVPDPDPAASAPVASAAAGNQPAPAEAGKAESGKAESGKAESGKAESGKAESGKAESGKAESGKAESGLATAEPADPAQLSPAEAAGPREADAGPEAAAPAVADDAAGSPDKDAGQPAAASVPGDQGSLGYQPTELAVPVARGGQAAGAPAKGAQPTETQPKEAQSKQAQAQPPQPTPTPSFTAAKQAERAAPGFSAASPARQPTPPASRPAFGPGSSASGYPADGGTAPLQQPAGQYPTGGGYGPSGGQYPPGGNQYAGPSQLYPDLAQQYAPGSTGGRRSGRGSKRFAWLAVAVVAAAGVGVGAALALNGHSSGGNGSSVSAGSVPDTLSSLKSVNALNNPTTAVPQGWQTVTLSSSDLGSTAGFSVDLPPGWQVNRKNTATDFTAPRGDLLFEVDVTPQLGTNMLAVATTLEHERVDVAHAFPGYKRLNLQEVPVRNTAGAVWKFSWTPANGPGLVADDILFRKQTSAGWQDYAVYIRSPQSTFSGTSLPLFDRILRTFQTVPASPTLPPVTASPSQPASSSSSS